MEAEFFTQIRKRASFATIELLDAEVQLRAQLVGRCNVVGVVHALILV